MMGSMESYSIRFPQIVASVLHPFAKKMGWLKSVAVQADAEKREYRSMVSSKLNRGDEVIKKLRTYIRDCNNISGAALDKYDYAALMGFCHQAYFMGEGNINPNYVEVLLDITIEIMQKLDPNLYYPHYHYLRSKLCIEDGESCEEGVKRNQLEIFRMPSFSVAEVITRPLAHLMDDVQSMKIEDLQGIFDRRLKKILPVAVKGAKRNDDTYKFTIGKDMAEPMPKPTVIKFGNLTAHLCPQTFCLVVSDGSRCHEFRPESVLGLANSIECGFFDSFNKNGVLGAFSFNLVETSTLKIIYFDGQYHFHELGDYCLALSEADLKELLFKLEKCFESQQWKWLINAHRELGGDC